MAVVSVSALWVYPVKSLAGIALPAATITQAGLQGDRQWMIVDPKGQFVTQRKLPLLATIAPSFAADGTLQLTDADGCTVTVKRPTGTARPVRVWGDVCLGRAAAEDVNQWLTRAIGSPLPLTLVLFDQQQPRPTDSERFGRFTTHFADAAPLLVANSASLDALNEHLSEQDKLPVDMRRFRPNVVVEGLPAFAEHQCVSLQHHRIQMGLVDHCQRCSVITVEQSSGIASSDRSPFSELAQINSMPGKPKAPAFGVNSVLLAGNGETIACGDKFTVEFAAKAQGLDGSVSA